MLAEDGICLVVNAGRVNDLGVGAGGGITVQLHAWGSGEVSVLAMR